MQHFRYLLSSTAHFREGMHKEVQSNTCARTEAVVIAESNTPLGEWSDLNEDILAKVLALLSLGDILSVAQVCRFWRLAAFKVTTLEYRTTNTRPSTSLTIFLSPQEQRHQSRRPAWLPRLKHLLPRFQNLRQLVLCGIPQMHLSLLCELGRTLEDCPALTHIDLSGCQVCECSGSQGKDAYLPQDSPFAESFEVSVVVFSSVLSLCTSTQPRTPSSHTCKRCHF